MEVESQRILLENLCIHNWNVLLHDLLYCFVYICEQLYWYVTSHKWLPVLMTSSTVKYNKLNKTIFAFVLQCPKWSSEKCGVCKSFHAWADKKVSAVLLI